MRSKTVLDIEDRNAQLKQMFKLIQSGSVNSKLWRGQQACKHPRLDVEDPQMMSFVQNQAPLKCSPEEDWIIINGSVARISPEVRKKYGDIECSFTDILRANDYASRMGLTTTTHTEFNLESSDFVRVHCIANNGKRWSNTMAGIRQDQDVIDRAGWEQLPKEAMHLNVLMFGFDSLSRNSFIRKLPKSYALLKELNAVVLEGYNIVGDGTPQALIPILTGKTELELPDTRRRMGEKAVHVNVYPFVWNNFHSNGYVTGFMEDTPSTGIFTYRLKGFDAVPTDHYMRTYYVDLMPEVSKHKNLCVGSLPRHVVMMDYARHMFTVYHDKPKFVFGFHGELSHDNYNLIGVADDDIVKWIKWFRDNGHLNNTIMIIMSDHGHRFASIRNTQQGKLEERLPFFSFVFPPWFERVYPEAMKNFRMNANRLTTPFDIHPTLLDILKFNGAGMGDISRRSISLFKEIPLERTCVDAYIEPHWCACLEWEKIHPMDSVIQEAAVYLVEFINKYNRRHSKLCATLQLDTVLWAARLLPSRALRKFRGSADKDGFVPDMSADLDITTETYQIKISVKPGGGLFEASLNFHIKDNKFNLRIEDISRINKYGSAARCIEQTQEQLRKFCYCESDG